MDINILAFTKKKIVRQKCNFCNADANAEMPMSRFPIGHLKDGNSRDNGQKRKHQEQIEQLTENHGAAVAIYDAPIVEIDDRIVTLNREKE